ncbi:hypothetical protein [Pseudidiomarina insulisalsae]|uniref:Uncharacterized protein n=1 Tax=Pseudidiomarina insulisalsae TaxID=575789 RepID=A0A432Y8U2_9GAMM|nr:hypothetical protein [Pseudidiomarina insulisalsae]RUO57343.1 hypothetical protein CWI71_11860 [Pseudidiomarina insulisalsae]
MDQWLLYHRLPGTTSGFILPIIVLLLTFTGLIWVSIPMPVAGKVTELEQDRIREELLFWHKAMVAYAFQHDSLVMNFSFIGNYYELEIPRLRLADGNQLNLSGISINPNQLVLEIVNLPAALQDDYLTRFPGSMREGFFDKLLMTVKAVDSWAVNQALIRRNASRQVVLDTPINMLGNGLLNLARLQGNLTTESATIQQNGIMTRAHGIMLEVEQLQLTYAQVGGHDLQAMVDQFLLLEQQMLLCLQPKGACFN